MSDENMTDEPRLVQSPVARIVELVLGSKEQEAPDEKPGEKPKEEKPKEDPMIKPAKEGGENYAHLIYLVKSKESRMTVHLDIVYDNDDPDVVHEAFKAVQRVLTEMSEGIDNG